MIVVGEPFRIGRIAIQAPTTKGKAMTTEAYDADATHDAWIIGTHELPNEFSGIDAPEGSVVVVDKDRNIFDVLTQEEFDAEYEWCVEGW